MNKLEVNKRIGFQLVLIILISLILSPNAFSYIEYLPKETQDFVKSYKIDHTYEGKDKSLNLYTQFYFESNPIKNPLIIVTGLEDPIPSWFRVAMKAQQKGFRYIYIIEIRGQGQSQRVLGEESQLIYVDQFEDYVYDLLAALKDISSKIKGDIKPPYILSHSTGSTVVGNALASVKEFVPKMYPLKMSFWAPLVQVKISPILKNDIIQSILSAVNRACLFLGYPIMVREFKAVDFSKNHITTSKKQHLLAQKLRFDGGLGSRGISLQWVVQALKGTQKFREKSVSKINMPTLLLMAEDEMIVDNNFEFKNKKIKSYKVPRARHALHVEAEPIFDKVIDLTFKFFLAD